MSDTALSRQDAAEILRPINLAPVGRTPKEHPYGFINQRVPDSHADETVQSHQAAQVYDRMIRAFPRGEHNDFFRNTLLGMMAPRGMRGPDFELAREQMAMRAESVNEIAKAFRSDIRAYQSVAAGENGPRKLPRMSEHRTKALRTELAKSMELAKSGALAKAVLDVGTLTNFAQITGGEALGFVSLDTRIARGTVRPDSFTLYQALPKSPAYQVVDYWAYNDDTGGPLPGGAFQGFSNVQSGVLATDAGIYNLQNINLALAMDGRAMTVALAAQNSMVDVVANENANAALTVLSSVDYASYFGNPTLFPNQPVGLASSIPTNNIFDFQQFMSVNGALNGWSIPQGLYNLIYEAAAVITSAGRFGRITHAFMSPTCAGSLQGLVTTVLNNLINNLTPEQIRTPGIIVDGDLQGMRTRFGTIQFPMDLFITARDTPAQGQPRSNGSTPTTSTNPTPPASVTVALSGATSPGSNWGVNNGAYAASGAWGSARYAYAVASTDANSNESTLTWSAVTSGITTTGAMTLTIAPPAAHDAAAFRVFRTGNGGFASGTNSPTAVRFIGTVLASGSNNVTFVDNNTYLPGSETIFLLDMREEDFALDWRFLLPLTRIELFAQNLYMPWAVAMIGAIRNRIPKFHGLIRNYIPDNPVFNPLQPNV